MESRFGEKFHQKPGVGVVLFDEQNLER